MKMREFLYFIYILNFWIYICEYIFIYKNVWFYLIYKWSYQFLNADKGLGSFFDWWKCSVTCRDSDCQSASARSMANTVKDTNDSVPPPPHFFYARAKSIGRGRHSECPTFRWTSDCRHGASSSSESSWTPGDMQPAWPLFRRICYRVSCKALRWNPIMYVWHVPVTRTTSGTSRARTDSSHRSVGPTVVSDHYYLVGLWSTLMENMNMMQS